MYRQSPNRAHRSKGIKIKHVLQICLLLAVCFWLIYQVKHSHDKKKEFDESDSKTSLNIGTSNEILKLGRKDIRPRMEETDNKNGKRDEAAIEQETIEEEVEDNKREEEVEDNKHEEEEEDNKHEEDEQEIKKDGQKEDKGTGGGGGGGGGDDEINEHELEKPDAEIDREEEFIDEEKQGNEGDESNTEEKDSEENNGAMEKESSLEDSDHDGDENSANEAREENYKADDASSAVAHDNQNADPENENGSLENIKEQPETNILEWENKENGEGINLGDKRTDLEVKANDVAESDNKLNVTTSEAEGNLKEKSENSSLSNTTLTEGTIDPRETSNNLSEVRMESHDPSLLNGTESKLELNHGRNGSVGGTTSGEANNSTADVDNNHIDSNSTILVKNKDPESSSGEFSDSSNNSESSVSENIGSELSVEAGNNTESLTEKNDATEVEKYGGTDEFSDQTSEEVQRDSIISSDSSNSLDEKDVRTDLETLPEIQTAGTGIEDAAAE